MHQNYELENGESEYLRNMKRKQIYRNLIILQEAWLDAYLSKKSKWMGRINSELDQLSALNKE